MNDERIEAMQDEIDYRDELLAWAYSKLHSYSFSKMDDAMKLDEIKLLLEHGV